MFIIRINYHRLDVNSRDKTKTMTKYLIIYANLRPKLPATGCLALLNNMPVSYL